MASATQAIINLHALRDNYSQAKVMSPNSLVYANLTGNAYGHGLLPVANGLISSVDGFMVGYLEEALQLRQGGVLLPILLRQPPITAQACQQCSDLGLEIVVYSLAHLAWLGGLSGSISVWIQVDTGQGQPGCRVQDVPAFVSQLRKCRQVSQIQLFSEFCCAALPTDPRNDAQQKALDTLSAMKLPWSISDSAGIITRPHSHGYMVRMGLVLYGVNPLKESCGTAWPFQPVMTLQSMVVDCVTIPMGESLPNGRIAIQDSQLAVIGLGYADGYPGLAQLGTPVVIKGKKWPLLAAVGVNTLLVDVTASDVAIGDTVTLWGTGLAINEVGEHCGTSCQELLYKITARVKLKYLGS